MFAFLIYLYWERLYSSHVWLLICEPGNITAEHREKAVMLAQNAPLLRRKLKNKTFRQAALLRGVNIEELKPRSLASFKTSVFEFVIIVSIYIYIMCTYAMPASLQMCMALA